MAKHLILVSHGRFCEELKNSTEMIMGPQEKIHTVSLLPEEGPVDFQAKFEAVIEKLDEFVVFSDLQGGTPCNVISKLILEGRRIELYSGMNMPMVIGFLNGQLVNENVDYVNFAMSNIYHVNDLLFVSNEVIEE